MLRLIPILIALTSAGFSSRTDQSGPTWPGNRLAAFQQWLDLTRSHEPGTVDGSVKTLRSLSMLRLTELQTDLGIFAAFLNDRELAAKLGRAARYTAVELRLMSGMADAEQSRGTANALLRQIALLHTDAASLPGAVAFVVAGGLSGPADVSLAHDGIGLGGARTPPHWKIARAALGALDPNTAADPWARQWYQATTAYLFYSIQLASLPLHLVERKAQIPDDTGAWFDEGCLAEEFSSDRVQMTVLTERARGVFLDVPSAQAALERARWLFGEALTRDRDHAEARLRLARVQLRLGDARASAGELTTLLAAQPAEPEIRYLAHLFLGAARRALGNAAGAVESYEQALKLYPTAQSAAITLLLVKPDAGDEQRSSVESILNLPAVDRTDPWFDYYLGPGRRAQALMKSLWRSPIDRRPGL